MNKGAYRVSASLILLAGCGLVVAAEKPEDGRYSERISDTCYSVPRYKRVLTPEYRLGDVTVVSERYLYAGRVTVCSKSYASPAPTFNDGTAVK